MGSTDIVAAEDLPAEMFERSEGDGPLPNYQEVLNKAKREMLEKAFTRAGGDYKQAAALLGLSPTYIYRLRNEDGSFNSRFFLHGWRHLNANAQKRILELKPGENLYVTIELTNPVTRLAVQIQTEDYYVIGWAPRYLVTDLVHAIANSPGEYKAKVVRLNPAPAPVMQRLLIELTGRWGDYQPMSSSDFEPLAA